LREDALTKGDEDRERTGMMRTAVAELDEDDAGVKVE
jgi:hypothetical protein